MDRIKILIENFKLKKPLKCKNNIFYCIRRKSKQLKQQIHLP